MTGNRNFLAALTITGGILTAVFIPLAPAWWLLLSLTPVFLGIVFFIFNRKGIGWLFIICLFGLAAFLFSAARQSHQANLNRNRVFHNQTITVTGIQIKRSEATRYGGEFVIRVNPQNAHGPTGKLTIISRKPIPANWYGRPMAVTGRFKANPVQEGPIPGFMEKQGISGTLFASERPTPLKGPGLLFPYLWANQIRESMLGKEGNILSPRNSRLLRGMIFNDRLSNDPGDRRLMYELQRTGTIHLLSVSGLHIGFLVLSLTWLLDLLRVPRKHQLAPLAAGVWFYILMTGMNPPVLRSGIMMLIYMTAEILETRDSPINRLALAASLLLLGNPYNLFEVGFQLSFTATLGVVWLFPLLKEYFPLRNHILRTLRDGLLLSLAAQLLVTPLIVHYFQLISWVSPLVNLILIIPAEISVIGGLLGEGAAALAALGQLMLIPVDWDLSFTRLIVHWFASQSWAASYCPGWPWPWIIAYYLGLLLVLESLRPDLLNGKRLFHYNFRYNFGWFLLGLLFLANLTIWTVIFRQLPGRYLEVAVIDVGQGDAVYLRTPEGYNILIDGGDEGRGVARVVPFLRAHGVSRLNLALITHYHQDHAAGMAEVLQDIPADTLYLPPEDGSREQRTFLSRLKGVKIKRHIVTDREVISFDRSLKGEVLQDNAAVDENDRSLVLVVFFGKNKLLLTGDLGEEGEGIIARKHPQFLRASVLKVGHHGSNRGTSLQFLTQVKPRLAVISVGAENRFGHPGGQTLNRLRSLGIPVYRTDRRGTVSIRIYQNRILVTTTKGGLDETD